MKKFLKGLSLILMLCILCCSMSVFTSAVTIQPLWININTMTVSITFNGTDGIARGIATRQAGVTSMEGTVTLYMYVLNKWVCLDQWSGSSTGYSLIISGYFNGISGEQYKAVFEVTAYSDDFAESETQTTYKTCP